MGHISQLLVSQLPDPNDTQDYGSDFDDSELEELNHEIDRIYGKEGRPSQADTEDNPITNDVENISAEQPVAKVPLLSQRSGPLHVEFEDDTSTAAPSDGSKTAITHPDSKLLFDLFASKGFI